MNCVILQFFLLNERVCYCICYFSVSKWLLSEILASIFYQSIPDRMAFVRSFFPLHPFDKPNENIHNPQYIYNAGHSAVNVRVAHRVACVNVHVIGTETLWPILLLLNALPALLCCIVLPFMPESPRYLMLVRKDNDSATKGEFAKLVKLTPLFIVPK